MWQAGYGAFPFKPAFDSSPEGCVHSCVSFHSLTQSVQCQFCKSLHPCQTLLSVHAFLRRTVLTHRAFFDLLVLTLNFYHSFRGGKKWALHVLYLSQYSFSFPFGLALLCLSSVCPNVMIMLYLLQLESLMIPAAFIHREGLQSIHWCPSSKKKRGKEQIMALSFQNIWILILPLQRHHGLVLISL